MCPRSLLALVFALHVACPTVGAQEAPSIADVLAANPFVAATCSFATTSTSSERPGETRVERFTAGEAGEEGQWRLVSVNGASPSADALADYAGDIEAGRRRDEPVFDLAPFVHQGAVAVESADPSAFAFSFKPSDMPNLDPDKVRGTLFVAKDDLRALRMTVELLGPVSPAPGVKVKAMNQEMTFATDPVTGALLLQSIAVDAKGRAFFVKKIEQEERIALSDFECRLNEDPAL